MAATPWPTADCRFYAERGTWNEEKEGNLAEFKPEVGPPKRRRRTFLPSFLVSFEMLVSTSELEALEDFYTDDLVDGIESFTGTDPRLGTTETYTFISCKWRDVGPDLWRVMLQLRRLP